MVISGPPISMLAPSAASSAELPEPVRSAVLRAWARTWRAISWTTAASAAAVVELVADGRLPQSGFIAQESIRLDDLLSTKNGSLFAELGKV